MYVNIEQAVFHGHMSLANLEVMHVFGRLDLLYPKSSMTRVKTLQIAIDGETYDYT
jgi:hypothetical protein